MMKAILPILLLGATLVSAETPVTTSSSRMTGAVPARFLAEELDERVLELRKRLAIRAK